MTPKELSEYIEVCKKHGVIELTLDTLSFKLDPYTNVEPPQLNKPKDPASDPSTEEQYSDEDILLWSSGGTLPNLEQDLKTE